MEPIGFGFGLDVGIYDAGDGCPGKGLSNAQHLGSLQRLSKGELEEFDVPARRRIFFDLRESENVLIRAWASCRLVVGWFVEAGRSYEFQFTTTIGQCGVSATDATTKQKVSLISPAECESHAPTMQRQVSE